MVRMQTEKVEVIDNNFNVLRVVPRSQAIKENLRHKIALIIVKNSKGQIYITQINRTKKTFPLKWATGAGGAVNVGETFDNAAKRELKEELGVAVPIKFLFDFDYESDINTYKAKVYLAIYDGKISPNKKECETGKWVSKEELERYIEKELLCPGMTLFMQKFLDEFDK